MLTRLEAVTFAEAWPTRLQVEYAGIPVNVIGLDELIRNKRAVGRPQDRLDVRKLERRRREKGPG